MSQTLDYEEERRLLGELSLWALRELSDNVPTILDCPVVGRAVAEQVRIFRDADLQRRELATRRGLALPGCSELLETLKKAFPNEDPVLLLWRVRFEEFQTSLASSGVLPERPAISRASYRALVEGLYVHPWAAIKSLRNALYNEVHVKGRSLRGEDVQEARDWYRRVIRAWREGGDEAARLIFGAPLSKRGE